MLIFDKHSKLRDLVRRILRTSVLMIPSRIKLSVKSESFLTSRRTLSHAVEQAFYSAPT